MKRRYMKFRHDALKAIPFILMGAVLLWSGYNLVFGGNGVFALSGMVVQEERLQAHLDELRTRREAVESRVVRLRPDSLDWDLVEEQAILNLGALPEDAKALRM
jgi:cell division protein FtsB